MLREKFVLKYTFNGIIQFFADRRKEGRKI